MREALLGQNRRLRAGNSPWTRLVPLRKLLAAGQRELLRRLLLLLGLGYRSLARNVNGDGDSWLRHIVRISPHLRRDDVAR